MPPTTGDDAEARSAPALRSFIGPMTRATPRWRRRALWGVLALVMALAALTDEEISALETAVQTAFQSS